MPFWKRGSREPEEAPPPPPAAPQPVVGTLPCSERGCANATGEPCGYVDRRARPCGTAWCPDHQSIVAGTVYCRRHAGVVGALSGAEPGAGLPDIENRAPSLVNWVSRDVEQVIQEIVTARSAELGTDRLISDPVHLAFVGPERLRIWERTWKLVDHTGWSMRVGLEVDEARDTQVAVRVGRNIVARLTPPWIEARRRGEQVPPEVDSAQREAFYTELADAVATAVDAELALRRGIS
jgi:hypothetical protein